MRRRLNWTMAAVGLLGLALPARAGLVISVDQSTLARETPSAVKVYIESDDPSGDLVNFFQYEFRIATITGTGRLEFQGMSAAVHDALVADPDYIFSGIGDPLATAAGSPAFDTVSGGDFRPDLENSVVGAGAAGRKLLTILELAPGAGPYLPSDDATFAIVMNPATAGNDYDGSSPTGFFAHDRNLDADIPVAFRLSAVPEPSTWILALSGLASPWSGTVLREDDALGRHKIGHS